MGRIKNQSNATDHASLILLGFRHVDSIPLRFTLDRSYFLYPNEEMIKGSAVAFANLHAAMIRKNVLAVGEYLSRATATSRPVAVYPQQEVTEVGEDGASAIQVTPPGMILIELPFEDDIRVLEEDGGKVVPEEESIEAAMKLVRKLTIRDFDLSMFENQALMQFWNYIEAVALETKARAPEDFEPILDEEAILEAAGDRINAFRDSLPQDVKVEKATRKRKVVEDDSGCDWVDLFRTNSISSCTVATLKKFLGSRGARLSGKKAELAFRVGQMIGEEIQKENRVESSGD